MSAISRRFDGLHIAVTGAGSGIGRAIAERLSREGATLSLFARQEARLRETAATLPGRTLVASCDIRQRAEVERAFSAAHRAQGPFYALVANSGIGGANAAGETDRFDDLIATNLTGTYSCLRAAQARLAAGPSARHLLVISSILARIGVAGYSGYCASKAGLLGLVRALAVELAPNNVQVNALCPGWVETAMAHEGLEAMAAAMSTSTERAREVALSAVPLARMSQPAEIAATVAWLLSEDARGLTGHALDINNGAFMN